MKFSVNVPVTHVSTIFFLWKKKKKKSGENDVSNIFL